MSIMENAGDGIDTVKTALGTYTLGANLENLTYTGTGTALHRHRQRARQRHHRRRRDGHAERRRRAAGRTRWSAAPATTPTS